MAKRKRGEITYREIYEVLDSSFPFHYLINGLVNLYAVNATDEVIRLLGLKGIKVEGTREYLIPQWSGHAKA